MPLAPGTQLGPYEIVAPLGAGGMGEVYRARDTRLERTVAIKILPAQFAADPVRKQRFEREAKTISSLNHPHVCVLHDVGHQGGMDYLVMECVEGETLAKRLEKGPLPLEQVLQVGMQTADALAKAHRSSLVHRDLKPGNIMLTPTGAKLLDFGLAKPAVPLAAAATLTADANHPSPVTEQGSIIGTVQYMSPEQVEGKELDSRSDIFSLGVVLYEMLTGKRAFEGKSQLSVASAILEKEPAPISSVKRMTPPALDRCIRRCLAKEPERRWQNAGDLASELQWIAESGSQAGEAERVPAVRARWQRASWLLAGTFFLLTLAAGVAWWQASNRRPPAMYFHAAVPFATSDLALSPDGRTLAMVAYSAQASSSVLWTYEIGSRRTVLLEGTQGAAYPFWSPDGKSLGFFADGKLKRVDVTGGHPQVLCGAPNGRGGSWNRDGVILFSPNSLGGLSRVSSSGGTSVEVTQPDSSRAESSNRWPVFLPDGKHFLYLGANFSGRLEKDAIFLASLDSKEKHLLVSSSANAAFADPGYLLYLRDRTLVAQPFDLRRFVLGGEPHALSDEVMYTPLVDKVVFSVAGGDVLVTQTGKGASHSQLTWFDRSGKPAGTVGAPGTFNNLRLSPDGRRAATDETDPDGRNIDVWIHDLARDATTRLTFDPALDQMPVWSPDGRQVLFDSNRRSSFELFIKNSDGSGADQRAADLTAGPADIILPWDWSHDGKYILFSMGNALSYLAWPERVAKPLMQAKSPFRNAQFSPDGRWIAYSSNESGNPEVYVSSFPSLNGKWQISTSGGNEPRWRRDGKELFYVSLEGKMMAVPLQTGGSFQAGAPMALFQTHRRPPVSSQDFFSYDVSADGQKFLIATKGEESNPAPLSVFLNWASEMEK